MLQLSELSYFSNKSMFLKIKKISAQNLSGGADTQNFSHTLPNLYFKKFCIL